MRRRYPPRSDASAGFQTRITLEAPSSAPEASRPRTARNGARLLTAIAVSKPVHRADARGDSRLADGPLRISQRETSVAPFQLANTVTWPLLSALAAIAGWSVGLPVQGRRKVR